MLNLKLNTVDGILKQFNKMIEQLDTVSNYHNTQIENNIGQIDRLTQDNKAREAEVKRALSVRNNIEKLIKE